MSAAEFLSVNRIDALFVGDCECPEFREVCEELEAATELSRVRDVISAQQQLDGGIEPDLIVVAQTRPGQVSPKQVHALRRQAPLARIVGLLGSWCEGESRTGNPWPAIPRIYWHQWPNASRREIEKLAAQQSSWWQLPPTAAPDERFLLESGHDLNSHHGLVVIASPRWESSEALADACRAAGYHSVWHRRERPARTHGAAAVIWDGSGLELRDEQEIRFLSSQYPGAPLVALLNYPRVETVALARQCGATAVLSKPLLVEDLLGALASPSKAHA